MTIINFREKGYLLGAELFGTQIEFSSKPKKCNIGYPCSRACISTQKICRKQIQGDSKTFVAWAVNHLSLGGELSESQLAKISNLPTARTPLTTENRSRSIQKAIRRLSKQPQQNTSDTAQLTATNIKPGAVGDMAISEIKADPKRFQFKIIGEHTSTGEVGSLSGVKKFDKDLAGIVQVWKDPADSQVYVINGHNRLALAQRLGETKITVRSINANSASEARAIGALTNIAEGRGTSVDAAKFFKDSGLSKNELSKKGIPLREKVATEGLALASLHPDIFRKVIDGGLSPEKGAIIGSGGLSPEGQKGVVDLIDKKSKKGNVSNETLSELVSIAKSSESVQTTELSLFGTDTKTESLALHKAEIQGYVRQQMASDKKLFARVSKGKNASTLESEGNTINVDKSKARADSTELALRQFDTLKNVNSDISKILNRFSELVAGGMPIAKAKKEALAEISKSLIGE